MNVSPLALGMAASERRTLARDRRPLARLAVNMLALAVWLVVGAAVVAVVGIAIGG